jgi:hypothetical protein
MSDVELADVLRHAGSGYEGIGGSKLSIRVGGTPVFVKLIRLTDPERDAGPACTRNLFDLPTYYQYGVGSTGFNVWREVAAHELASAWVLDGACPNFPLLYHWRVLPRRGPTTATADIDQAVRFWGNSAAVQTRLRALEDSTAVIALFLEHVPFVLRDWLTDQLANSTSRSLSRIALVEQELFGAVDHLRSQGFIHFDAHFDNVLTDGHHVYVSDFGLVTARRFQLSSVEQHFVQLATDHDLAYCAAALVNAIVSTVADVATPRTRNDYVRRCAESGKAAALGRFGDMVVRYAPAASIMNDFYWQLFDANFSAPFPAADVATALKAADLLRQ